MPIIDADFLTMEKYNELTAKKNETFSKLNKQGKSLLLAKDVIAQIKEGKYRAKKGTWCTFATNKCGLSDKQFNSFDVQQSIAFCEVCGLGSLFCSLVKITNNVTFGELAYKPVFALLKERLIDVLSMKELSAIELSFEVNFGSTFITSNSYRSLGRKTHLTAGNKKFDLNFFKYLQEALVFGRKYIKPEERLLAIMRNIVKNKGQFKPNDIYYV